jgi:BASS family bile acid:Na+ symporter
MDLATLIPLVLRLSIVLTVFALGLGVSPDDVLSLRRRPWHLLRSLTAMNVVMPLVAVGLATALDLKPAVEIALVALSISPVPPLLPRKAVKAGGKPSFAFGLLLAAGLFAIVFIPAALELIGLVFKVPVRLSALSVAKIVGMTVFLPLGAGMAVKVVAPAFAGRVTRPLSLAATVMLFAALIPILFTNWPSIVSLFGNGTVLAFAAFIVAGLAVGHLLGGPDPDDRTVVAYSTASRHPGMALTIAAANFPDQKLVMPAVLLYLLVGAVVTIPYAAWRNRRSKQPGESG